MPFVRLETIIVFILKIYKNQGVHHIKVRAYK